jgi:GH35 family endo-1,4-beta-xylanase
LRLVFRHGLGPQTYEIGGLEWTNRGPAPAPPAPLGSLIASDSTHRYSAYFDNSAGGGSARVVPATGPGFTEAVQVQVNGTSQYIYNAQLGWVTTAPVAKNDALLLSFYARVLQSRNGFIEAQIVFERNADPYDKSVTFTFPVASSEWQLLQVPFRAHAAFNAGAAHLQLQFAAGPQRFEFANLQLQNYGQLPDIGGLPSRSVTPVDLAYTTLLDEAGQRIRDLRRTPLTIVVTDAAGTPLPGVEVRVQQLRHAFRFGSAVTANGIIQPGQDNEIYRSRIASHFTTSVLENDLKWPSWECATCRPNYDQQQTRDAIDWLLVHGIPVRGHNLIWPSFRNMPSDAQRLKPEDLRARIDRHFDNVLTDPGIAGKLYQWDVVNEPFDNYDVQGRIAGVPGVPPSSGILGNDELLAWFRHARAQAPDVQLVLNDYYNIEAAIANPHEDYTLRFLQWMQQNQAPLDAVGMQAHFGAARSLTRMQSVIDRFAALGLPLAITEFDFNTADEAAQAAFTRDFMTLIFSRPEFDDFLMWGFWASRHWLPLGAMYAADWTSKPNALAYNRLLFHDWWTHESGTTADDGSVTMPVYRGDHQVIVWGPNGPLAQTVRATEPGTVTIAIPSGDAPSAHPSKTVIRSH